MLNYWWVTRPKRKLNSVPEVLATFAEISLNQQWSGQRESHLTIEEALENAGLKRKGERRDQTGGGARTYKAWLLSLGLIFTQKTTGNLMLTLAGEAIIEGDSPVKVLTNQIMKYQFPSVFSTGRGVRLSPRFKIRPFRFLLKLLRDPRVLYLTNEEIAEVVAVDAENETDACYENIVQEIHEFRIKGSNALVADFFERYSPSKGAVNPEHPFSHLLDLANTMINWLEYTQFIERINGQIRILKEKIHEVDEILSVVPPFIDRVDDEEYFQRKYGLDPNDKKDTRNLSATKTITTKMIAEHQIKQAYIGESLKHPITKITTDLIDKITEMTGFDTSLVEDTLLRLYPHGSIGSFMTEYFEMAFKGRDEATEFEKATVALMQDVFGFQAKHVGPIGLTPDVLLLSDTEGYQGIIDNKAYSRYTISNDHHNRMVHNYIGNLKNYSDSTYPLAFFSYIAGGFGNTFDKQLMEIYQDTGVKGSGMTVSNMIKLVECHNKNPFTHEEIRSIFMVNRQVKLKDIIR